MPDPHRVTQPRALSATSRLSLHTSRDGDSKSSLGSPCQCLTNLSSRKSILISNLSLPCNSLRPFPLILCLVPWEQSPTPSWLPPPVREWWRARRCPLNLLEKSRLSPSSSLSCSWGPRPFCSSVPFPGRAPAPPGLSGRQRPRTGHGIQGTSAVPSTRG